MSRFPLWAVLTPGEPARLESRVRAVLMLEEEDEEDGKEPSFEVIPGSGRYQAIVGMDPIDVGAELQIAEELSLEFDEPVYSIERAREPWLVMSFRKGVGRAEEKELEALAKFLGCPLPGSEESSDLPARKPLRHVALVEGVRAHEAHSQSGFQMRLPME